MIGSALSSTFHGRDIFSPVGARLARGEDWDKVGPGISNLVRLDITAPRFDEKGITAEVIGLDGPYGNLVTNIDAGQFQKLGYATGRRVTAKIGDRDFVLPFVKTFSDVPVNEPLLYVDSRGRIGLAINQGNFARVHNITPPVRIFISRAG
jgi:S-adenosylmethionine hydrolase